MTATRRAASAAVTAAAGVLALAAGVTGLTSSFGSTASADSSLAALKARTEAAVSVNAHGLNAEGYEGDEAPEGIDVDDEVPTETLVQRAAAVAANDSVSSGRAGIGCSDDGRSGNRVQVMYVVAADRPDRFSQVSGLLRSYSSEVDSVMLASAMENGGRRQVRWVHDTSCELVLEHVVVGAKDDDSFPALTSALKAMGHNRPDRKYLLYTDAAVLCGVANVYADNTPLSSNANNGRFPQYARVDAPCWAASDHSVEAHELTHTLGAVLSFAPHKSAAGHCTDESDVMCYPDGDGVRMTQSCPTTHEKLLDCNGDDYFNVNPKPGSALAQNWNAANSSFLYDPPAPALVSGTYDGTTVSVKPQVLSGQGWSISWAGSGCQVSSARTVSTSPKAASVGAACRQGGTVRATLRQEDGRTAQLVVTAGATSAAPATPAPGTAPAPATTATLSANAREASIVAGKQAVVQGTLASGQAGVPGLRVDLQRRTGSAWGRVATAYTSSLGTVSFSQLPRATTTYRLVFAGGSGLDALSSSAVTVRVAPKVTVQAKGLRVSGTVSPAKRGTVVSLVKASKRVATSRTDAKGRFLLKAPKAGTGYTVVVPGSTVVLRNALSAR
ncbi:hypothetical protein [Motilibacter aurantiacus]|uniref:hypothetical protein n=1 Tax=Motilibacter aurantiacus TaxID=2714955 RepID=UPI00140B89D5|nr:hypothetical protein [Motilibacter aurantiacus]NHC45291.1 hypothetical protein [Motilibacter aurantiacus]